MTRSAPCYALGACWLIACAPTTNDSTQPAQSADGPAEAAEAATADAEPRATPAANGQGERGCLGLSDEPLCESSSAAPPTDGAPRNVLGEDLAPCGAAPMTGFYRDGLCRTGPRDAGVHVVCAEVDRAFLDYTKAQGNDLETPSPTFSFPGLEPGDRWCLCAARWEEARRAGVAPPVVLEATDDHALRHVELERLKAHRAASAVSALVAR